jgi:hypothetical protein
MMGWCLRLAAAALMCVSASAWALDADAALKRLMREQYGVYSARAGGWLFKSPGSAFVMKVIQSKKIVTPDGERLYVFAAGNLSGGGSHVASGLAGAFVLEERDGRVNLVAASRAMPYGSFGSAPDKVKLMQFGPDYYYGWVYESGYTGQGYTSSYNDVLLPKGRGVASLASIPSHMDNEGASPCDNKEARDGCESLDFSFQIDTARKDVKVYPLTVTRKGIQKGHETKPETWHIGFDEKKWQYDVPAALKVQY